VYIYVKYCGFCSLCQLAEVALEKALSEQLRAAWRPDVDQSALLVVLGSCPPESLRGDVRGSWWEEMVTSTQTSVERLAVTIEESAAPWWDAFLPMPGGQPPQNAEEARGSALFASLCDGFDAKAGHIQKVTNTVATMTTVMGNLTHLERLFPLAAEAADDMKQKVVLCLGKGRQFLEGMQLIEALRGDLGPPVRSPMEVKGCLGAAGVSGSLREAVKQLLAAIPMGDVRGGADVPETGAIVPKTEAEAVDSLAPVGEPPAEARAVVPEVRVVVPSAGAVVPKAPEDGPAAAALKGGTVVPKTFAETGPAVAPKDGAVVPKGSGSLSPDHGSADPLTTTAAAVAAQALSPAADVAASSAPINDSAADVQVAEVAEASGAAIVAAVVVGAVPAGTKATTAKTAKAAGGLASPAVSEPPPKKARTFPTKQTTLDKSCSSGRE